MGFFGAKKKMREEEKLRSRSMLYRTDKFKVGEEAIDTYGNRVTIHDQEGKYSYIVIHSDGTKQTVFESDLKKVQK